MDIVCAFSLALHLISKAARYLAHFSFLPPGTCSSYSAIRDGTIIPHEFDVDIGIMVMCAVRRTRCDNKLRYYYPPFVIIIHQLVFGDVQFNTLTTDLPAGGPM